MAQVLWNMDHKQCPKCNEYAAKAESSCIWCGSSLADTPTLYAIFLKEAEQQRPKCPLCNGTLERMDAGRRGTAFAEGNLLGAFTHTHRCTKCGHLV
jgi:uncharacterized protein with PIN domain